ncbi:MAG TPA: thioredoxin family protein [Candidatus Polarisedimenticolaceae bacterium]|nr:thioredoxin family protein [Candidatus Polarisedimenticolaceae bacterium]
MTNDDRTLGTLRDAVRDYYDGQAVDDAVLRRLMAGRERDERPWRWAIAGALAAMLVLAATGVGLKGSAWLPARGDAEATPALPRLVAVQIRADWCARTPEVGPVFARLVSQYGGEPILFVTVDISDDARREQAALLTANLGIPEALEAPFESGMIKLLDRDRRRLLAAVTDPAQLEQFETRIAEALSGAKGDARGGA